MRSKKRRKQSETPELRFRRKLIEEYGKMPGMMVKAERMGQGSMERYQVKYVHASQLDARDLEICLQAYWGSGTCLLRFVDETREPLDEYGSLWIDLGNYDDLDDRLEEAQSAADMATVKIMMEMEQSKRDKEMDSLTVLAGLAGNIRRNRINPGMFDALKHSIESARPDDSKVTHEIMKLMSEMRDEQHQQSMKQQADAVQQFLDLMPPEVQTALQAQGLECQTPAEPVGHRFPQGNCSPPIVGLPLQRLKTNGIQGLGKIQDRGEDDQ